MRAGDEVPLVTMVPFTAKRHALRLVAMLLIVSFAASSSASAREQAPLPFSPAVTPSEGQPVSAMEPSPYLQEKTIHDGATVTNCICGRQRVSEFAQQLAVAKHDYDEDQTRLSQVQSALDSARTHIDVNNVDEVSAFRRLSVQQEEQASKLNERTQPSYAAAAKRYNEAVTSYNAQCAGRGLDPATVAQVQRRLICRSPELP